MMPIGRVVSRPLGVVCLVLAVAGCGTGSGSTAPSQAPAATPIPTQSPAPSAAPPSAPAPSTAAPSAVAALDLWPAPPNPLERTVAAGLQPGPKEYGTNHVHAHLDVFLDGTPITVPSGIGIDTANPDVHRFDQPDGTVAWGGIQMCSTPCISPLHTHDPSGILHTESRTQQPNTLGEFFIEWGVPLTESCVGTDCTKPVAFYVDGKPFTQDPRNIELTDRREIAIVIGTPPAEIPATADFSGA